MGVNKVEYGSSALVDLTGDTVTPESLLSGYTAHDANGNRIVGTASSGVKILTCETKAEWDAMSESEKNDPDIWWHRPWA